jgi:hypothetical protein
MYRLAIKTLLAIVILGLACVVALAQETSRSRSDKASEFGPVMRAYLGYLRNEQEVVDDRISRREISSDYYRRNSNRIRALRQMAVRLVTTNDNDYVPELEAVTSDEFGILFENRPNVRTFHINQIVANTFRYLGTVTTGEVFYVFARLDPYEQAALLEKSEPQSSTSAPEPTGANGQHVGQSSTRLRRVVP